MTSSYRRCKFFYTRGGCKFGVNCRFLHDTSILSNRSEEQPDQHFQQLSTSEADFRSWMYQIPRDNDVSRARSLGKDLSTLFKLALRLLKQDAGTRQEVVTRLASEGGLLRLRELEQLIVESEGCSASTCRLLFTNYMSPFFQVIADDGVNNSLILESSVHTVLNFLFGPGGRRSVVLFTFAARAILLTFEDDSFNDVAELTPKLEACLNVFWKVINLNGSAPIIEEFKVIAESFANAWQHSTVDDSDWSFSRAKSFLTKIKRRLMVGRDIPEANGERNARIKEKAVFAVARDAPGWLSEQGARHDNDFQDIKSVKIMPTAQEIQSSRLEYLPTTDPFHLHILGVEGLLDRHFRLLREDTVGQLRDAVNVEFEHRFRPNSAALIQRSKKNNLRSFVYEDARLFHVNLHKYRGLDLIYDFAQPQTLRALSREERTRWWESSKRLQPGALVCVLDARATPIFCSVSQFKELPRKQRDQGQDAGYVHEESQRILVTLSLVDTDLCGIDVVLRGFIRGQGRGSEVIIEFPGVLLPSFRPTLQTLQRMAKDLDMPFAKLLAPSSHEELQVREILPPVYSTKHGFRFDLDCLINDSEGPLAFTVNEKFDFEALQKHSILDEKQASALIDALSRSLALIQGPPGTGKSFTGIAIIKVLLANARKARLGPIICVCYTNHALDQLLEHLIRHGVDQIVRVGSRSKSELLENVNLRAVSELMERTKIEKRALWELNRKLDSHVTEINGLLNEFSTVGSLENVRAFLEGHFPAHAAELFIEPSVDEEGFEEVRYNARDPLHDWLNDTRTAQGQNTNPPRCLAELQITPLGKMTPSERESLYESWVAEARASVKARMLHEFNEYFDIRTQKEIARQELDLRCLQQAKVIGVTTSGLARITNLLGRLGSKVLVCEEAAEVLEPHMLTALLPSIEHAILIGDHLQLRPQIQNYNLSSENSRGVQFSLDVSLFERLVKPPLTDEPIVEIPFSVLETQRRMHPSVSNLIRSTLYPDLKDSRNVASYPPVSGMRKRLFWLDHREPEATPESGTIMDSSHSNNFEVYMTTALVSHLVRQGQYASCEIAVLTPYLGQLRKLRQELGKTFVVTVSDRDLADLDKQGLDVALSETASIRKTTLLKALRVATIDNFQGEEAKVVVISLVRSNDWNKCGFLRTENRINVALSRAQHGMYIIGNAETSGHVEMWAKILSLLEKDGNIGNTLGLCCARHPNTTIEVKTPDDFSKFAPEGGCSLMCEKRLQCGHACINKCHADFLHNIVRCLEPCHKSVSGCELHPCPNACGDTCPARCEVRIKDLHLPCGHLQDLPCHAAKGTVSALCGSSVPFTIYACGHEIIVECHKTRDPSSIVCTASCAAILWCGHECKRTCSSCKTADEETITAEDHGTCQQICGRPYSTCSHSCSAPCHGGSVCGLCQAQCDVRCIHSACKKRCFEPCTPCAEQHCASACPHDRCNYPCAVPCSWIPCSTRCVETLDCGHQCPSLCGEQCPSSNFCQVCCSEDKKNLSVDFILGQTYEEIELDDDPCIFPQCGHIMTLSSMDGLLDMAAHYEMKEGRAIAIKGGSLPFSSTDMKRCPSCRGSLRDVARYGRIVRRALLDESTKRLDTWARKESTELERRLLLMEDGMKDTHLTQPSIASIVLTLSQDRQFDFIKSIKGLPETLKESVILRNDLSRFRKRAEKESQPYQKVWSMIQDIRRRRGTSTADIPNDVQTVLPHYSVSASYLLLRWELGIVSHILNARRTAKGFPILTSNGEHDIDLTAHLQDCLGLVTAARSAKLPVRETQAHLLFARFVALQRSVPASATDINSDLDLPGTETHRHGSSTEELGGNALHHLERARGLCASHPKLTKGLLGEIEQIEKMLRDSFYASVSSNERRSVVAAMAREFRGTGHWYYCKNGHPFTIGECGMPMEEASCPECDAPVGGSHHLAVAGVSRAEDLELDFGELHLDD